MKRTTMKLDASTVQVRRNRKSSNQSYLSRTSKDYFDKTVERASKKFTETLTEKLSKLTENA